jgi:hypothetical protein
VATPRHVQNERRPRRHLTTTTPHLIHNTHCNDDDAARQWSPPDVLRRLTVMTYTVVTVCIRLAMWQRQVA